MGERPDTRLRGTDVGWTLLLTAVVLGPLLLGGGFWLFGDMVFVPRQPWKGAWLGLDGGLPRAVPMDAIVSVATHLVPGWVVQRVLLVGGFLAGGLGAARLVRLHSRPARLAGISIYLWNPWVLERLAMGQWAILLGYLLLPSVALAAARLREGRVRAVPALFLAMLAAAVCSPSSGLMAALTALVLGLGRPRLLARAATVVGIAVVVNLPWLVPTATASTTITVSGVFDEFAARGESALGLLASLVSLGGTWKTSIVPTERTEVVVVVLAGVLTAVALLGLRARRRHPSEPGTRPLLVLAAIALALAWVPSVRWGAAGLEELGSWVPGTAVLRDSHRFLAPAALVLVPGLAGAAEAVRARARPGAEASWSVVLLLVLAPLLLLPSLAWGLGGSAQRSSYPAEWNEVAEIVADGEGATVVLPWAGSYRRFSWNHERAVLDPAPRFFPGTVLVDDSTVLGPTTIPSEDPAVAAVTLALDAEDPAAALRDLGVQWVVVEQEVAGQVVPEGEVVHDGAGLVVIDLGVPENPAIGSGTTVRSTMIGITDVLVLVLMLVMVAGQVYVSMLDRRSDRFGEDADDEGGSS